MPVYIYLKTCNCIHVWDSERNETERNPKSRRKNLMGIRSHPMRSHGTHSHFAKCEIHCFVWVFFRETNVWVWWANDQIKIIAELSRKHQHRSARCVAHNLFIHSRLTASHFGRQEWVWRVILGIIFCPWHTFNREQMRMRWVLDATVLFLPRTTYTWVRESVCMLCS